MGQLGYVVLVLISVYFVFLVLKNLLGHLLLVFSVFAFRPVQARVLSCRVVEKSDPNTESDVAEVPVLTYEYSVDGRSYRCGRISFLEWVDFSPYQYFMSVPRPAASAISSAYREAEPLTAYYWPPFPGLAVLQRKASLKEASLLVGYAILAGITVLACLGEAMTR